MDSICSFYERTSLIDLFYFYSRKNLIILIMNTTGSIKTNPIAIKNDWIFSVNSSISIQK